MERPSLTLRAPITLGVVMIVLVVILAGLWVGGTIFAALTTQPSSGLFWVMLGTGSVLLSGVLAGVIAYLTLTVKAFNLNRRQSNFIDSVTHELKSPIASLKLYLQTMTRHEVSPEQRREFHRIMMEDVERLDSLINHLLSAAWVEQGQKEVKIVDIDVATLLKQCADAACLRYKVPATTVTLDTPTIVMRAPLIQMEILFRNLIDNAVKYGGTPPAVDVTVTQSDPRGEVVFVVGDNGTGIPSNLRRKVFGRFVRLGNELERSKPGTGLGLYLVRNVTHSLGGRINIRDRATGTGTQFEVSLPQSPPSNE